MSVEFIISWAGWLLAGIERNAPVIVGLAAMWLALFLAVAAAALVRRAGQKRLGDYLGYVLTSTAIVGMFFLISWLEDVARDNWALAWRIYELRLWYEPDDFGAIAGWSALVFVAFVAIGGAGDWISKAVGETPTQAALMFRPRTVAERFVWVSAMSPAAGFCEEVFFRGILLNIAFDFGADAVIAVAVTSLLFGLAHASYGLTGTIATSAMGAAAGAGVLASGSLWPAIVAHALYDMTVFFIFEDGAPAKGDCDAPASAETGPA